MTTPTQLRPTLDLLSDLRAAVDDRPRWRLHVHPDSAMWITIGVQNAGMAAYVRVVGDPACAEIGKGWIETLTVDQWRKLRALVGQQVTVSTAPLGTLSGTLLALDDKEARLDLGDGDVRYLPWITVEPVEPRTADIEAYRQAFLRVFDPTGIDAFRQAFLQAGGPSGADYTAIRAGLDAALRESGTAAALTEAADLRAVFAMQWDRMTEATARWRAEDPEARALLTPDLGVLLQWLMNDADRAGTM